MSSLDAEYLEKDYCSNFVCCGVPLADLHELVSHFEESHVTVVSSNGMLLPPGQPDSPTDVLSPQTASSSALESPRSAYSSTPPPPNLFPTLTSAFQPRESAFTPVTTSPSRDPNPRTNEYAYDRATQHLPKEEQYVFDSMLHSEAYDCNASAGMQVPMDVHPHNTQFRLHPAQVSGVPIHNPTSVAPHYTSYRPDLTSAYTHPPTLAPTPVYARPPTLTIITESQPQDQHPAKKRRGGTQSRVSASESEPLVPPRRRVSAQKQPIREKVYKCPRAGCIKSYMNTNGLKYHLTKGACDYATTR